MQGNQENRLRQAKRRTKTSVDTSAVKLVKRDSLTRTKAVLNAALRVWELKQRLRTEQS